jgi:hypothetical protein
LSGCKRQAGMPVLLIAIGQIILASSAEFVGKFWLRETSKLMI